MADAETAHLETSHTQQAGDADAQEPGQQQDQELHGELWTTLGPLEPPANCENVTADGGVLKHVLEPGTGDKPKQFARCLVHYLGRHQSTGYIFLDSKMESQSHQPVKVIAGRHTSPTETGLYMGVATMRVGERAVIYVQDYKYGYGEKGSFSFPAVPPEARLAYDVELVDFENPQDEKLGDPSNLMYEERLERAERRRILGNELFAEGRYKEALAKYAGALSYMDEDFMMQLEGFYEDKANEIKAPIHLNMAACQLKLKDYHTAIYNCGEVLRINPDSSKAYYRRGVARHALQQTEGALADLTKAADMAPDDKAIAKELYNLKQTIKAERQAQAKLYKGQFKFPDVKPKAQDDPSSDAGTSSQDATRGLRQRKAGAAGGSGEGAAGQKRQETASGRGWLSWLLGLVLVALLGGWFLRGGL